MSFLCVRCPSMMKIDWRNSYVRYWSATTPEFYFSFTQTSSKCLCLFSLWTKGVRTITLKWNKNWHSNYCSIHLRTAFTVQHFKYILNAHLLVFVVNLLSPFFQSHGTKTTAIFEQVCWVFLSIKCVLCEWVSVGTRRSKWYESRNLLLAISISNAVNQTWTIVVVID